MSEGFALPRDLACVDLETTGGHAGRHRITEIGVVEVDADGTRREWSTLVNPGVRIPPQIIQFTGITNEMVADAPSFADVCTQLLDRLHGRLFVAHNARFDYGFIRAELARLGMRWTAPVLCTVRLSRRLYPEHRRHNLDSVMARHGLECSARHRALGDARVLADLLDVWQREIGLTRLAQAVELLQREVPLPAQLPPDMADDLPDAPGIYRFLGEADALLYIGKSRNIRTRVLEHFAAAQRSTAEARLAAQVRRVTFEETAGELGALLREARAVKVEQPLQNRRLRARVSTWTLRLVPVADRPARLEVVELDALEGEAREEIYGLFRDRRVAVNALEEIARAHQLCARVLGVERGAGSGAEEGGSCFGFQLKRCRGACVGLEPPALHDTRTRLALAPQRIARWPFRGRILIVERDWRGEMDCHLLEGWRYIASVPTPDDADGVRTDAIAFDPDIYRILKRFIAAPGEARIVELD